MRYRQNTKGAILYGPPVILRYSLSNMILKNPLQAIVE